MPERGGRGTGEAAVAGDGGVRPDFGVDEEEGAHAVSAATGVATGVADEGGPLSAPTTVGGNDEARTSRRSPGGLRRAEWSSESGVEPRVSLDRSAIGSHQP